MTTPDVSAARAGLLALPALVGLVTVAWCHSTSTSTLADLGRPAAYVEDLSKSDTIAVYAGLKASTVGEAVPFLWKTVSRLNAPFAASWDDWPILDELHNLVLMLAAMMFGVFGGLNVVLFLGHLLAAGTFYCVARAGGGNVRWSFVGGLAFGLAPFTFAQSPHHSAVAWAWHVPLFTLVWRWVATDPGLERGTLRVKQAVGIGLLTGLLNVYYTNIFCQLTLVGAALSYLRTRLRPALLAAWGVVGAAAIGFAVSNFDTWSYAAVNGSNGNAVVRKYAWLEIFGLKIKDFFIPPVTHRCDAFRTFGENHRKEAFLNDECGCPYMDIIGLACLMWLAAASVACVVRGREKRIPLEGWEVLWIVLMFTTGGVNAIIGALGFTMFRAGTRYSVVALAIVLLWAARRLSAVDSVATAQRFQRGLPGSVAWPAAALAASGLILWDQVPQPPFGERIAEMQRLVEADREFAEKMEAELPDGAMVFQLPVMEFPESPVTGIPSSYDHFRPYLFSERLRFSFGTHKGREREKWQLAVEAKFLQWASFDQQADMLRLKLDDTRVAVDELKRLGFSAIYVNRKGFRDRGKGIVDALFRLGYTKPTISNATGDLVCIPL